MAIGDYSPTAALNTTINGVSIAEGCPAPNLNNGLRELMADLATFVAGSLFPTGTVMLFVQSAAPTGWTKDTTHNNKALRIVNGTAGSGGTVDFTTVFVSQAVSGTTDAHVLTSAEMPAHTHNSGVCDNEGTMFNRATVAASPSATRGIDGSDSGTVEAVTSSTGSGGGHTHAFSATALNLAVKYVDCIVASRD